jgi:hypothetical protein
MRTTRKRTSVSPVNPCTDTRENRALLLLRHCWRGHVTPPHSCVMGTSEARPCDASCDPSRHDRPRLGTVRRKHRFVYCCVIAGTCFEVTALAWRKYATIYIYIYIYIYIAEWVWVQTLNPRLPLNLCDMDRTLPIVWNPVRNLSNVQISHNLANIFITNAYDSC